MPINPNPMCGPSDGAPSVTNKYAKCNVCGTQWQVQNVDGDDAKGCSFCNAPAKAISILSEKPDYGGEYNSVYRRAG